MEDMQTAESITLSSGHTILFDKTDMDLVLSYSWEVSHRGYVVRKARHNESKNATRSISMHRNIMGLQTGGGGMVDHINGNKLDNRRCNLRAANQYTNQWNRGKPNIPTTSRFKGVRWVESDRKWRSAIVLFRKSHSLGQYEREESAALSYEIAAQLIHGEFAKLKILSPTTVKDIPTSLENIILLAKVIAITSERIPLLRII